MPDRRDFLISCLAAAALPIASSAPAADNAPALPPVEIVRDVPPALPSVLRVTPATRGPSHHFVGYYGITPFDATDRRLACLEVTFGDRLVQADDRAAVCLVDTATGDLHPIAQTSAWNLQQGAMLHWLPTAPDRQLVYNDRVDGRLVSVVLDVADNTRRLIDRPVAAVAPDGRTAIGLNFDRLRQIRPVTGYAGGKTDAPLVPRPTDDGLFAIDVPTGKSRLLISVDTACRAAGDLPADVAAQPVWLEHPAFCRDGSRLFFMARAFHPRSRTIVSVPLTANADGTNLRPLLPWAPNAGSHYDWLDASRFALTHEAAPGKWQHLLFGEKDHPTGRPLAETVLTRDGHCTFSPDGRWMITDTYPDQDRRQHVYVMNVVTGQAARIASFAAPAQYRGDYRCDLHPRWNRTGNQICIDSTHDGVRQVYVLDLRLP
jgi:hypothetical protein